MQTIKNLEMMEYIENSLRKNNFTTKIKNIKLKKVLNDYKRLLNNVRSNSRYGKFTSFDEAACIMIAISKNHLVNTQYDNIEIAIDTALAICENPVEYSKSGYKERTNETVSFSYIEEDKSTNFKIKNNMTNLILASNDNDYNMCKNSSFILGLIYDNAVANKKVKEKALK